MPRYKTFPEAKKRLTLLKQSKREGEAETTGRTYMNGPEEKNVYIAYFVWCIITLSHTLGVSSLQTRFRNLMTYEFDCFRTFNWCQ